MPLRHINAAARARERELHLERLHSISQRATSSSSAAAPWRAPAVPRPLPQQPSHGPRATKHTVAALAARSEQASHARRMQELMDGTARILQKHREYAQVAGRATLGTQSDRRKVQAEIARDNIVLQHHIRHAKPRLASPSTIALLKGGGKAAKIGGAVEDQDDDEAAD